MSDNGDGNGKVYVKFGPGPTQEMPIEWAEKMLTEWRQRDAARFGKALAAVVTEGVNWKGAGLCASTSCITDGNGAG